MSLSLSDTIKNTSPALAIVRQEWQKIWGRAPTDPEALFTLAVAWLETHYGRTGQFAPLAAQGLYNWANIEKQIPSTGCPDGWVPGKDSSQDVCFRVYPSDEEAASALISTLTKRHWPVVQTIAQTPTPAAVAHAMKTSPAYYSAPEAGYAQALQLAINAIQKEVGPMGVGPGSTNPSNPYYPPYVAKIPSASLSTATAILIPGLIFGGGLYYLKTRKQ